VTHCASRSTCKEQVQLRLFDVLQQLQHARALQLFLIGRQVCRQHLRGGVMLRHAKHIIKRHMRHTSHITRHKSHVTFVISVRRSGHFGWMKSAQANSCCSLSSRCASSAWLMEDCSTCSDV